MKARRYALWNASKPPPLDHDPTLLMRFRTLNLDRYNSHLKARARSHDPMDFRGMWSMRDIRLDHIRRL